MEVERDVFLARAETCRQRSAEMREIAERVSAPEARREYLQIAGQYDNMAAQLERMANMPI
jgi:UTP:GlnB (protein PII) uridylyltransferase